MVTLRLTGLEAAAMRLVRLASRFAESSVQPDALEIRLVAECAFQ